MVNNLLSANGWFIGILIVLIVLTALFGVILWLMLKPKKEDPEEEKEKLYGLSSALTEILEKETDERKRAIVEQKLRDVRSTERFVHLVNGAEHRPARPARPAGAPPANPAARPANPAANRAPAPAAKPAPEAKPAAEKNEGSAEHIAPVSERPEEKAEVKPEVKPAPAPAVKPATAPAPAAKLAPEAKPSEEKKD